MTAQFDKNKATCNELLAAIIAVFPHASIGEDNDGQIIVYTDYYYDEDATIAANNGESIFTHS